MIIDENEKKEGKNEKQIAYLSKCYLFLNFRFSSELLSICVPCLLKIASKKEESEEAQKEVEVALLALSNIEQSDKLDQKLYLTDITEIIEYNQEHQHLTRLAYQSAWQFLGKGFFKEKILEDVITNELYLGRDAVRELEDLSKSVDWKRKEERGKEAKEVKEVLITGRLLSAINDNLAWCTLWNESFTGLIGRIVQVFRASRDNNREIDMECIESMSKAACCKTVKDVVLLISGAVDDVSEEIQQPTSNHNLMSRKIKWKM
ncbi:uncharacterized protein MONOS_15802 [Monocercomonoides exilis]|uniref:uncharacterized protein n=1 Tax=Monocercomonoides exilis TaxID=2049356 RepID=UPI003559F304|nr:hypothetical protein MONOS_15802 [Monocercomonoides exilis]|eukprot:MONOS_15802.1-p1 / transcript=MONOS_15802.1 / gene=MONOS_15802 / organism=Monocercomonoides_exilis_PA203 / gene_product=unspecified product / transcript_product=unspecified product / location=Mono_scaffold01360:6863-7772(-) / protein_length=262 / sequence_SO=supercontig / SO=protein_coding / is_pseudo=false